MPKYKVLVKNTIEIGKYKSKNGILDVVNPSKIEVKKIENAVATNILKAPTKTPPPPPPVE